MSAKDKPVSTPGRRLGMGLNRRKSSTFTPPKAMQPTTEMTPVKRTPRRSNAFTSPLKDLNRGDMKRTLTLSPEIPAKRTKLNDSSNDELLDLSEQELMEKIRVVEEDIVRKTAQLTQGSDKGETVKLAKLEDLERLRQLWLLGCHAALDELLELFRANDDKADMLQLLTQMRIPPEAVNFDPETMDFVV